MRFLTAFAEDADMNIWITAPSREKLQPYLDRLANLPIANFPLWGIPFAIKDNIDLAGVDTTAGCARICLYTRRERSCCRAISGSWSNTAWQNESRSVRDRTCRNEKPSWGDT